MVMKEGEDGDAEHDYWDDDQMTKCCDHSILSNFQDCKSARNLTQKGSNSRTLTGKSKDIIPRGKHRLPNSQCSKNIPIFFNAFCICVCIKNERMFTGRKQCIPVEFFCRVCCNIRQIIRRNCLSVGNICRTCLFYLKKKNLKMVIKLEMTLKRTNSTGFGFCAKNEFFQPKYEILKYKPDVFC